MFKKFQITMRINYWALHVICLLQDMFYRKELLQKKFDYYIAIINSKLNILSLSDITIHFSFNLFHS